MMKITFATTCMGRKQHLISTLPYNLATNKYPNVEFLILDYNSPDGLAEWVRQTLGDRLGNDVNYYRESTRRFFVAAHAKNVAALASSGEIVVNVDADQCIEADLGFRLAAALEHPHTIAWPETGRGTGVPSDVAGLIALRKEDFVALGGYDEDMHHGWGLEDTDLEVRAAALGYRHEKLAITWRFIRHPDSMRIENTERRLSKAHSRALHCEIRDRALHEGRHVANRGRIAGKAMLIRNFSTEAGVGLNTSFAGL